MLKIAGAHHANFSDPFVSSYWTGYLIVKIHNSPCVNHVLSSDTYLGPCPVRPRVGLLTC